MLLHRQKCKGVRLLEWFREHCARRESGTTSDFSGSVVRIVPPAK